MADQTAARLIPAYVRASASVRSGLIRYLLALWDGLTGHRSDQAAPFIRQVVPVIAGAQQQTARLTAAYLSATLTGQLGRPVPAVPVRPADVARLREVDPQDLYQRPFTQIYTDLSEGQPYTSAVEAGRTRLVSLAETDVQLAKTHTARRQLAEVSEEITGYRRVLAGDHSCGLCVIASTQRYHGGDLLPIHPGCDCTVAPIIGDAGRAQVIDQELLDAAHAAIAERFGKADFGARGLDYRKVLLVREHGEIGPVLTVAGDRFTGPDDLGTDRSRSFRNHKAAKAEVEAEDETATGSES